MKSPLESFFKHFSWKEKGEKVSSNSDVASAERGPEGQVGRREGAQAAFGASPKVLPGFGREGERFLASSKPARRHPSSSVTLGRLRLFWTSISMLFSQTVNFSHI